MNYLNKEIKNMEGYLVGIGIDEKLYDTIQNNKKITKCDLLGEAGIISKKKKLKLFGRRKKVNIKKFRKFFKKKRVDNIICNYLTIKKFTKYFVKDSIYICKGDIYLICSDKEKEDLKEKYLRYTNNIEEKKNLLIIHSNDTKTIFFKDTKYFIKDSVNSFLDILSLILSN